MDYYQFEGPRPPKKTDKNRQLSDIEVTPKS